jgi:hypothetical protein
VGAAGQRVASGDEKKQRGLGPRCLSDVLLVRWAVPRSNYIRLHSVKETNMLNRVFFLSVSVCNAVCEIFATSSKYFCYACRHRCHPFSKHSPFRQTLPKNSWFLHFQRCMYSNYVRHRFRQGLLSA